MSKNWLSLLLAVPILLFSEGTQEPLSRIYAHVHIHDTTSAIREARGALLAFPESADVKRALITSLSMHGEELEALKTWHSFKDSFQDERVKRLLLEQIAWGVIHSADHSTQNLVRLYAIIGASLTRDARSLPLLLDALRGSNATLRAIAVRLSVSMRDTLLQEELLRLLQTEPNWHVRLEVIQAVGRLQIKEGQSALKQIVASDASTPQERQAAITALIQMLDRVEPQEIACLFKSPYSGHRALACEIVSYFELDREVEGVLALLQDSSSDVRMAALNCLALLGKKSALQRVKQLESDLPSEVAITASWAALLLGDDPEKSPLRAWLHSARECDRSLAAGAVATLGARGVQIAYEGLKSSDDLYVQVTLAKGLIGQRAHTELAADAILKALNEKSTALWMWSTHPNPMFESLAKSTLWHTEELANYPYVVDQLIRLELLSLLATIDDPRAMCAVKEFLQHQRAQVVGAAAYVLLETGDEEALRLVKGLLGEKEEKVRLQAALNLALFGKDPDALATLQSLYPKVRTEEKLSILEALSHVGDAASIPFFVERLAEPHQTLRVAAASALMQALSN